MQPLHFLAVLSLLEASVYRGAWQAKYPQATALEVEGATSLFVDSLPLSLPTLWVLLSPCPHRALATHPQAT